MPPSGKARPAGVSKGARPLQQSRLGQQSRSAQQRAAPLRQASLLQLPGVSHHTEDSSLGVATTLYLGDEDVRRLKATLDDAARVDAEALLAVLKRLSAMPCTRELLESTRIGVSAHASPRLASPLLSSRLASPRLSSPSLPSPPLPSPLLP